MGAATGLYAIGSLTGDEGPGYTPSVRRRVLVLAIFAGLSLAASRDGGAACQSTCTQQLVECKRTCSGGGQARRECRAACAERSSCTAPGTRIRTLAYVVSKCTASGFHQQLQIRRGNCDPVTVLDFPEPADPRASPSLASTCALIGPLRSGVASSPIIGVFERLGVSPSGRLIVVEVTDDFGGYPRLPPGYQEGFFVVSADGSGGHWIAPPSRDPVFRLRFPDSSSPTGFRAGDYTLLSFSPDQREVVFTDRPEGEDAIQIFTLDLQTGTRVQWTHLPYVGDREEGAVGLWPGIRFPAFGSDGTISFFSYGNVDGTNAKEHLVRWLITAPGSRPRRVPEPTALPGSVVVTTFSISGPLSRSGVTVLRLPGTPENPTVLFDGVSEVFASKGRELLQLTNLRRADTTAPYLTRDRQRVIFTASTDRLRTNPSETCQLFSIGTLGAGLRQLTHFSQPSHSADGCNALAPPGCRIIPLAPNATTGTVVFYASCDPFGLNPLGDQIFTIRSDGSGLRQLTRAGGLVTEADGVSSENIGPVAYSGSASR